jgi:DNA-directed RNA polymerase specialized sigma24 family protein
MDLTEVVAIIAREFDEDIAQDVAVGILRQPEPPRDLLHYARVAARNVKALRYRKLYQARPADAEISEAILGPDARGEDVPLASENPEARAMARQEIERMDASLVLGAMTGESLNAQARAAGVNVNTAKSRARRAKLRKLVVMGFFFVWLGHDFIAWGEVPHESWDDCVENARIYEAEGVTTSSCYQAMRSTRQSEQDGASLDQERARSLHPH